MSPTIATLAALAAFPTVSSESNEALIRYAARRITEAGGRIHLLAGAQPGKFNMLASLGPSTGAGIVLSGHSDVVPVTGQDWHSDPFTLTERQGRLYARGASDMKGFLAAMLTAAERCDPAKLARPLHLAFSYDEEIGCVGVRDLLDRLRAERFQAQGCIIGEPTEMRVFTGHKGKVAGCVCCRGWAAHSANPALGCNAIMLAGAMLEEMRALQADLARGKRDDAFAFPFTSLQPGLIKGGVALNIVPDACDIAFEIRHLPGDDPQAIVARLREAGERLAAASPGGAVEIRVTNAYPGVETPPGAAVTRIALAAAGTQKTGKAGFGTEAGLFTQTLGLPAVICGPGSIDRAHKADEDVTPEELAACDAFLDRVIATLH
ncbi:acetylornithine deacetylase [Acidocella sp.]|uniref:acetylornithine deacetylase n=1 Tax=Acidocella sp. TaxID=50710 RepID=UPI002633ED02|nr:acetylornithine deacetylase [Acidocella sp.]